MHDKFIMKIEREHNYKNEKFKLIIENYNLTMFWPIISLQSNVQLLMQII